MSQNLPIAIVQSARGLNQEVGFAGSTFCRNQNLFDSCLTEVYGRASGGGLLRSIKVDQRSFVLLINRRDRVCELSLLAKNLSKQYWINWTRREVLERDAKCHESLVADDNSAPLLMTGFIFSLNASKGARCIGCKVKCDLGIRDFGGQSVCVSCLCRVAKLKFCGVPSADDSTNRSNRLYPTRPIGLTEIEAHPGRYCGHKRNYRQ